MNSYRATLRFITVEGRHHYRVEDVQADDLLDALRTLIDALPAAAGEADLVELRRQAPPEQREYTPE